MNEHDHEDFSIAIGHIEYARNLCDRGLRDHALEYINDAVDILDAIQTRIGESE